MKVVAWSKNISCAVDGEGIDTVTDFRPHLLGRSKRHNPLVFNRTVKAETIPEIAFEPRHLHPGTGPLASFGEGTPWTDDRVLAEINKQGGNTQVSY